jgi:ribosomal-protein-alanine N-acetyltransferase
MPVLQNSKVVILQPLTDDDAQAFFNLYFSEKEDAVLPEETPLQFTRRIISLCEIIWTIRLSSEPDTIIGDCALHHWDSKTGEIQIGGSLYPEYRGHGYMAAAFEQAIAHARHQLGVRIITGHTTTNNHSAIKLVQKLGFVKSHEDDEDTVLKLVI